MSNKIDTQTTTDKSQAKQPTKNVRNRSGHRVELSYNNEVIVFLPGKIVEVPMDLDIPNGLGLYVR